MHAHLNSARLAPKKANLMAKMVRGLPVPTAVELLRKTHKKSARLFEGVLRSAIANAEHNFKQDPHMMILKTVVVNQGTHYRRGTPMARGRVRPLKKFLCHITVTLGYLGEDSHTKGSSKKSSKKKEVSSKQDSSKKKEVSSKQDSSKKKEVSSKQEDVKTTLTP